MLRIPILLAVGAVLSLAASPAFAAGDCALQEITHNANANVPAISDDGQRIVFSAWADLVPGGNPDGNTEFFLYDLPTATFTQITHTSGDVQLVGPTISADGRWVAFASLADLTGGNRTGDSQVFLYAVDTATLTQISAGTTPKITADGRRVLFLDGTGGVSAYHVPTGQVSRVSSADSLDSIDATGRRIAFSSQADPLGRNGDDNREIFVYDAAADEMRQLTETAGAFGEWTNYGASLDGEGRLVAFLSVADLVPPGNADGNAELFLYELASGMTTQVTDSIGVTHSLAQVCRDGSRIAYDVELDSSTSNIRLYDRTLDAELAVTDVSRFWSQAPALSADGERVAFVSSADLVGSGKGRAYDLFLATCGRGGMMLESGRFRVEADWATPHGTSGEGHAVKLTDDAGYFWFFREDNIELMVKVLDACVAPFDRYWFFAAGLTNIEVTIRVEDTWAGETNTYVNPMGRPFEAIQDTDAFATCHVQTP